jgi:biotin carboxyl carrier protein
MPELILGLSVMLIAFRLPVFLLFSLALLSPVASYANNVLDMPMNDVTGVNTSQALPSAAATAEPIEAEPGALPVRWPNRGTLVKAYNKKGQPVRQQQTPDIPNITPMGAPPAGI